MNSDTQAVSSRTFREFKVVGKQRQSSVISSFDLEPTTGEALADWKAGQYLVLKLNINGQVLLRNYSMSAGPDGGRRLRIAVKREVVPVDRPELAAGIVSNYLHDQIEVGDSLTAAGPMGDFFLDESSDRSVVLLSGGVGITPMLSMLHSLATNSTRTVHFIHACENSDVHAFADEVAAQAALRDDIHVYFCYRNPSSMDRDAGRCHAEGLLTKAHLQAWLPLDDYDFYLCGPSAFMQSNWQLLRGLGVAKERIRYEFFGPATVLEESVLTPKPQPELVVTPSTVESVVAEAQNDGDSVQFLPQPDVHAWDTQSVSLLDFAEAQGLSPDFNCRSGLCNTCMCELVSGEVEYFEEPLDAPPTGKILLCCAKPKGAVVIKL